MGTPPQFDIPLYEVEELDMNAPSLRKIAGDLRALNTKLGIATVDDTHYQFLSDIPTIFHEEIREAIARIIRDLAMRNRGLEADLNGMEYALTTERERVKVMAAKMEEEKERHLKAVTILVKALEQHAPQTYATMLLDFLK